MTEERYPNKETFDEVALCEHIAQWLNDLIDLERFTDDELEPVITGFARMLHDSYRQGYAAGLENKDARDPTV